VERSVLKGWQHRVFPTQCDFQGYPTPDEFLQVRQAECVQSLIVAAFGVCRACPARIVCQASLLYLAWQGHCFLWPGLVQVSHV